ncbi:MAG TPA: GntR family transcriptional regulator [Phycicoccus sp.]|nr:GntR family transcriptional regulator [Phycicoccus sp.]
MLVRVDPSSSVPIYAQIAASIRRAVAEGTLAEGDRLAPARDLAEGLGVNLHTVLRGYQQLRDEGIVELRRGRGAVVTDRGARTAGTYAALAAYIDHARKAGLSTDEALALVREGMES